MAEAALHCDPIVLEAGMLAPLPMSGQCIRIDAPRMEFLFDNLERCWLHPVAIDGRPIEQIFRGRIPDFASHTFQVQFHARVPL